MNTHNPLTALIKNLPCFDDSVVIERIEAGQSSECFKVIASFEDSPVKTYFVKYDVNADFFDNELKASNEAAQLGISPTVIYSGKHWLVNEFIEGSTLDNCSSSINEKIDSALDLIKKCDLLTIQVPIFNINNIITHIMISRCFSNEQRNHVQKILHKLPIVENIKLVTCHGDVNFSNVITDNHSVWLIDFECACLAEKEFEIAMFFAINLLNTQQQNYALSAYRKLQPKVGIVAAKVSVYLMYSYLINGLWYMEKAQEIKISPSKRSDFYIVALEQLSLFDSMYPSDVSLSAIMR